MNRFGKNTAWDPTMHKATELSKGIVVITGATSGFGEAIARLVAAEWPEATLWLTGRRKERLDALVKELGADRTHGFTFDIRDRRAVEKFAATPGADRITVLVNNAGLAAGLDSFQSASIDDWEQMIDTNVKGLLYVTRAILPGMVERQCGHVVNLGSVAGHLVYPKGHVYCATKFAVRALNDAIRLDVNGSRVRVTSIDPGMAETEFSEVRFKGDKEKAASVYQGMKALSARDVAETVLWCLDRPAHVNIQDVVIMPTDQASPRDAFRR
jgi:3-hydroxy acid dehydrogenase/malonic semialdehyde reductase